MHESDDFWKENATKLNEKDHEQLKLGFFLFKVMPFRVFCRVLVKILNDSIDPNVLAVAAHDIGQYVKHYERGKKSVHLNISLKSSCSI